MKVVSIIYLFIFLIMATSCKTNEKGTQNEGCAKYFSDIKDKWTQQENSVYNIEDYNLIWNEKLNCMVDKPKSEILNLFGKPNEVTENEIHYFLKNECLKNEGGCVKFTLYLNNEGKVESIPRPIIQPSNR